VIEVITHHQQSPGGGTVGSTATVDSSDTTKSTSGSLSVQLARVYPDLTMAIISEMSLRMETCRPARRAALQRCLLPWLHNIQLVDTSLPPPDDQRSITLSLAAAQVEQAAVNRRCLKGDGWGSAHASELVLNNLMYMTVKFGNEQPTLMQDVWCALVECWPHNLRIALHYVFIVSTIAPDTLLCYVSGGFHTV
jgi:hypothetical protein